MELAATQKFCPDCQTWKVVEAFGINRSEKGGRARRCLVCNCAYNNAYQRQQRAQMLLERAQEAGQPKRGRPDRRAEAGRYTQAGSVRLAEELPESRIAAFFVGTHSREFLIDLCVELGIVEDAAA